MLHILCPVIILQFDIWGLSSTRCWGIWILSLNSRVSDSNPDKNQVSCGFKLSSIIYSVWVIRVKFPATIFLYLQFSPSFKWQVTIWTKKCLSNHSTQYILKDYFKICFHKKYREIPRYHIFFASILFPYLHFPAIIQLMPWGFNIWRIHKNRTNFFK